MRTIRNPIALLVLLGVIAAACGDSADYGATTVATRTPERTTPDRNEAPPQTAAPAPIAGDVDAPDAEYASPATTVVFDAPDERPERRLEEPADTRFEDYGVNPFVDPSRDPLSTFAVDVDTGAYTLMRAWVNEGFLPDPDAVRVEEYVNYFDAGYAPPSSGTFAVYADGAPTPYWGSRTDVLRIGVKAREVAERRRQDLNLTFVVDVSGSMKDQGKLRTVQDALAVLAGELDGLDRVSIVSYNTDARVELRPTPGDDAQILDVIDELRAGGSTNVEGGLLAGYDLADEMFDRDAVNRVVLLSDGVANVGNTSPDAILDRVGEAARRGIDLVTIGVGISTYNDVLLEQLADQGDGWYAYVDTFDEAERLFRSRLTTSLETVARDVKVQVEFDPDKVLEYRLIGFENRDVADDDFRDDSVDAGEINAGHSVTALYEVELTREAYRSDDRFAVVRLRWEDADRGRVDELEGDVTPAVLASRFDDADPRFRLATTVAAYAEVLRGSRWARGLDLGEVHDEARLLAGEIEDPDLEELVDLIDRAIRLGG